MRKLDIKKIPIKKIENLLKFHTILLALMMKQKKKTIFWYQNVMNQFFFLKFYQEKLYY